MLANTIIRMLLPIGIGLHRKKGLDVYLSGFVLCHFVLCVLLAGLALAVCAAGLRNVDL